MTDNKLCVFVCLFVCLFVFCYKTKKRWNLVRESMIDLFMKIMAFFPDIPGTNRASTPGWG